MLQPYYYTHNSQASVQRSGLARANSLLISDKEGGWSLGVAATAASIPLASLAAGGGAAASAGPARCWPRRHSGTVGASHSKYEERNRIILIPWGHTVLGDNTHSCTHCNTASRFT